MINPAYFRCGAAACFGLALTTAHPLGIAVAIAMPALVLSQPARRTSYAAALSYYGAALWPLIPGARNFLSPNVSPLAAFALWVFATAALASVWPLVWSFDRRQALWRAPLGLILSVLPPLGIIGFASPLIASGFLFPRTSWCGLLACALLSGGLAACPRSASAVTAAVALIANGLHPQNPQTLSTWRGVNTNFGAIAHGPIIPISEYQAGQSIQQYALSMDAKVVVFPETVVPTWTPATDAFWQQTLDALRASGKIILVGARLPVHSLRPFTTLYDFSSDLAALRGSVRTVSIAATHSYESRPSLVYDNAVVIRGAEHADFRQRIPVPIAMWNPFTARAARLHLFGPGAITIAGERAAILICYEQLLTWPILRSMAEHPTVLVAVANDHWAFNTRIPSFQSSAVRAWARLFALPYVSATNQ